MRHIEIVSHPLCPFAQRLVLTCLANGLVRGVDFNVVYLELATLREAAARYSPTGEVPALIVGGKLMTTITEHAAEYIDNIGKRRLFPTDPEQLLTVRERVYRAQLAINCLKNVFTAQSIAALDVALNVFFSHMIILDSDLRDVRDDVLVDDLRMDWIAFAPLFSLAMFHRALREHEAWEDIPKARDRGLQLVSHPLVQASCCPNYAHEFSKFFAVTSSIFETVLGHNESNVRQPRATDQSPLSLPITSPN